MQSELSVDATPGDCGGEWRCTDCGRDVTDEDVVMLPVGDSGKLERASCFECRFGE